MNYAMTFRALLLGSTVAWTGAAFAQPPATRPAPPAAQQSVAQPGIEGLELLDRLGRYKGPVASYHAVRPTPAQIQNVVQLSGRLGAGAGVKFGGEGLKADEAHRLWSSANDRSALFQVDMRTGNFVFDGGMNRYRKDGSTPGLPAEQGAAELARRRLAELGLSPEAGELKIAHVGGVSMGVTDSKGGNPKVYDKLRTVRFSRVLGGLPVEGDSRIVVQLGEGAAVSGLIYQWPTLTATRLAPDALAGVETVRSRALETLRSVAAKATRSRLVSADLVLYDDGLGTIEPAYHFVVEQDFPFPPGARTMNPFDFYVSALNKPQVQLPKANGAVNRPGEDRAATRPTRK